MRPSPMSHNPTLLVLDGRAAEESSRRVWGPRRLRCRLRWRKPLSAGNVEEVGLKSGRAAMWSRDRRHRGPAPPAPLFDTPFASRIATCLHLPNTHLSFLRRLPFLPSPSARRGRVPKRTFAVLQRRYAKNQYRFLLRLIIFSNNIAPQPGRAARCRMAP